MPTHNVASTDTTPVSDSNAEGPPVPIPNTEVKLCSGNNTCLATDREDSSLLTQANPCGKAEGLWFSVTPFLNEHLEQPLESVYTLVGIPAKPYIPP